MVKKDKPWGYPVGNTDPKKRGRSLGGDQPPKKDKGKKSGGKKKK
jgi:hypothetical protein